MDKYEAVRKLIACASAVLRLPKGTDIFSASAEQDCMGGTSIMLGCDCGPSIEDIARSLGLETTTRRYGSGTATRFMLEEVEVFQVVREANNAKDA